MKLRRFAPFLAVVLLFGTACISRQTPEQRLAKVRMAHEIVPVGSTTVHDAQGNPKLVVDLRVTNKGTVPLKHLTVLVQVRTPDGTLKVSKRTTLDLGNATPGVGIQAAATIPGVSLDENDQVTVELESNLPDNVLRSLPEYRDLFPASK
ncbi:MAG: hypothetical protein GXP47_04645 [Acidobacteria bacterium]|nr:hypothetical protein [Acidobacteriota bacterium]